MSATSGGGGSVSEGSEAGGSSQSTMSASDSPSTSFQNNLAENVTKITLSEENGVDVTGSKINLSFDADRQQKDGIVNVAFDYEDETNRGGEFKSISGSERKDKVPEAVNLELVNMVPYSNGNGTSYGVPVNGIPMKKDSEQVDMSTPYDEYFVPVNEHKKYMRGEKLYVTKDKRRPTSWRRCLSWIVACTVISVVLIVAILAGTGTILSQEQNYIKEASVGRNFAGSNSQPSVTDKSSSPTAEMYMYVPRSIESEFVIDNLDFDPALKDMNSSAYQQFANIMEDQLKTLLFDKETLEFGASDVGLRVVNVSRDPFKVNYRIGWNYKQGVNNPPEPIKMEDVKKRLVESLAKNQGYIDKYHIDGEAIKVNHVINSCQIDNGGCSHICYYNYITQEFTCTCPTHLVLDNSGKNCVAWTGPSENDAVPVPSHTAYPGMPYESTANPADVYESGANYEHDSHHFHSRPEGHSESSFESKSTGHENEERKYYEPTAEPEPVPGTGSDSSVKSENDYDHQNIHSTYDNNGQNAFLESTAAPNVQDKYHGHAGHFVNESNEPAAETTPELTPEHNSDSADGNSDHKTYSVYKQKEYELPKEAEPEPTPEPSSESDSEEKSHKGDHSVYVLKDHELVGEPTAEPAPEPSPESNSEGRGHNKDDHFIYGHKEHEPAAEPTAEPAPEPLPESNSEGGGHNEDDHYIYKHKEHEPAAEPTAEPAPEPSPDSDSEEKSHKGDHSVYGLKDHELVGEPTAEPAPEPSPESDSEGGVQNKDNHSIYGHKEHEPAAEPTAEPAPEPSPDSDSEEKSHKGDHSVYGLKNHESAAEPTAEPTPEPSPQSDSEVKGHNKDDHSIYGHKEHETAAEPTAEPAPEPSPDFDSEEKSHKGDHSVYGLKNHESAAERTAEPAPEPSPESNSEGRRHNKDDHSIYGHKEHEPAAEPTAEPAPEPSPESNSEGRSHNKDDHSIYGHKEHETAAESTTEHASAPSPQFDSEEKGHNKDDHSVYGLKNHESAAEPTAEHVSEPVTELNDAEGKTHDNNNHSVHIFRDQETEMKHTPEPAHETLQGENSDSEKHGNADSVVKDHKSAESKTEPDLEPTMHEKNDEKAITNFTYSEHEPKDNKPLAKPTPEPAFEFSANVNSEGKTNEHIGNSVHEYKEHVTATEPSSESVPEPTLNYKSEPTSNPDFKEDVHDSANNAAFGSKDRQKTADPVLQPGLKSSTYDQSTVYESKDQETMTETAHTSDFKKESDLYPTHELNNNQSISKVNVKPALEPTLGHPPESDSSNLNDSTNKDTIVNSGPFENTKQDYDLSKNPNTLLKTLPDNSDFKIKYPLEGSISVQNESNKENKSTQRVPYLEDILVSKPSPNSESQNGSGHSHNILDNVERVANGEPVIEEIIIEKPNRQSEGQIRINTSHPVMQEHMSNESDPNLTNLGASDGHTVTVVDHSSDNLTTGSVLMAEHQDDSHTQGAQLEVATDHTKIDYSTQEIEKTDYGQTENIKKSVINSGDQDSSLSSRHFNSGFDNLTIKSNAEKKFINDLHEHLTTTIKYEIQNDSLTVPVNGELLNLNSKLNVEGIYKQDNQTDMLDSKTEKEPNGTEQFVSIDPNSIHESHLPNIHETTAEPQASMTTLPTILPPRGVQKINEQLTNNKDSDEKKIQIDSTGNFKQNQTESNETKSPEEIFNNIKDDLLENEEFNTLIDKEYKTKETASAEGKDIINRYPNKSLKPEKKKLKDYIKSEKIDSDKKSEITTRPVIPEDFILQKHVNGNENTFDLDYSLQNEHTTKHDGGVTVIDPHGIDEVPGVSFKPHGINNHDISVLQTVAPDFKTETVFPSGMHELETLKPDFKNKQPDSKDLESKIDKEYKFDKDYKYEKQKVSKKKDLKKKVGGKDGKNVELDEGRKLFAKEEWDVSHEVRDVFETTMNPSLEKITVQPDAVSGSSDETTVPESYRVKFSGSETTLKPSLGTSAFEMWAKVHKNGITELPDSKPIKGVTGANITKTFELTTTEPNINLQTHDNKSLDPNRHLMIQEPSVKNTFNVSPGTVYDGQMSTVNLKNSEIKQVVNSNEHGGITAPGTVFDGIPEDTIVTNGKSESAQSTNGQNSTFVIYEKTHSVPKIMPVGMIVNATTADPTIIINGQSGNLQNGHIVRFANSTLHNSNSTVISIFNGTLSHPNSHSFSFTNYTTTFPNGSVVQPTIVVHGQSGALQDGHEIRFGNSTFQSFTTPSTSRMGNKAFITSNVYRIENASIPGTVFDGHFNPQNGHYHMFTNSSGTFVYTNTSTPPAFVIKGQSGDFGNATAYIIGNNTSRQFSKGFAIPHSVIFRNSTVFAVENVNPLEIQDTLVKPREMTSNDTVHFTRQMSPSFVSSGTSYKVNNYFGYISKCAAGQFQCLNGTSKRGSACISLSSKCDSINDCSDGSDEMGCIENGCPGNFQCSDNTCLKRNLVCNGILDCSDGKDEKNCENWKCEFDEFQCPSGRCIPIVWQCDNKPDCDNHTDEYNCQTSCGNDEYLCPEGWCIPLTYKCNGVRECINGEDEQLCDCSHEEFKCQTGGCVSVNQVCNGLDDCPDRSDEWDCVKLEPDSNLLKIRSPSGNFEPVCADDWSPKYSDEICTSMGYFSSVPIENEKSSITTETSFYVLKNDTTADFNKKIIVNFKKSEGNCFSGKLVEISCQEFSCGSRSMTDSSSVEARLVGGMSATAGQWPSVALIYNIRNFHSCTANVLTPRWVLASYNCLKMGNKNLNEQDWKFFGGSTVFEAEKDNAETRKILSIIPHPQVKFNQFLFTNDLALVELEQSLQFTSNLGAVCLPEQEIQPRQICVAAGWGMNSPEDKTIRQQLQYLPVPTMNLTECNSTEHYSGFITEDKICAGYNSVQKSLCYNEEGAPLMCVNDRGEWELQGVLSYHSNCGRGSHPSIFSSITPVKDWIKKTIRNNFDRKTSAVTKR